MKQLGQRQPDRPSRRGSTRTRAFAARGESGGTFRAQMHVNPATTSAAGSPGGGRFVSTGGGCSSGSAVRRRAAAAVRGLPHGAVVNHFCVPVSMSSHPFETGARSVKAATIHSCSKPSSWIQVRCRGCDAGDDVVVKTSVTVRHVVDCRTRLKAKSGPVSSNPFDVSQDNIGLPRPAGRGRGLFQDRNHPRGFDTGPLSQQMLTG